MRVLLAICLATLVSDAAQAEDALNQLKVTGGWVFDTDIGRFEPNRGILVKDGRFQSLSGKDARAKNELVLDDSHYVLPGLIDLHAHYNMRLVRKRREEFRVMPIVYLANGVTVTFSAGEFDPDGMEALRKKIESGEQLGPRLINSGPYFGRARPGWRRGRPAEEIRKEVDYWAARGVGGFKAKSIAPDELKALVERAHHHGLTVTGHLDSGVSQQRESARRNSGRNRSHRALLGRRRHAE